MELSGIKIPQSVPYTSTPLTPLLSGGRGGLGGLEEGDGVIIYSRPLL